MASCFLHTLKLGTIFECCGYERGAHRVRRVTAIEPKRGGVLAHHAIDYVGVHALAFLPRDCRCA